MARNACILQWPILAFTFMGSTKGAFVEVSLKGCPALRTFVFSSSFGRISHSPSYCQVVGFGESRDENILWMCTSITIIWGIEGNARVFEDHYLTFHFLCDRVLRQWELLGGLLFWMFIGMCILIFNSFIFAFPLCFLGGYLVLSHFISSAF